MPPLFFCAQSQTIAGGDPRPGFAAFARAHARVRVAAPGRVCLAAAAPVLPSAAFRCLLMLPRCTPCAARQPQITQS